ncbi:hypothetical protein [Halobacterium hubeiense]|uniref:hypothetical protein n=1 Tax=Halobacterium hubeiense TaxID=1407499 RepID=UPI003C784607
MLDDIEVPDDGSWGYSSGWVPDDVITAVARQQNDGSTDLSKFLSSEQATEAGPLKAYYAVEVKSITSGNRARLTENQQKMLPTISKNLDRVHPVVVTVDLNGLPETAEVTVNMYENSVWADGQISKTV